MGFLQLRVRSLVRVGVVLGLMMGLGVGASARESHAFAGTGGFSRSFTIVGGNYDIYIYAKSPSRSTYAGASKNCVFGGNLQRVGSKDDAMSFGNGVTVGPVIGYKLGPRQISLPAGVYAVYIASVTNCMWHATLQSADDNGAGLAPLEVQTEKSDGPVESVTLRDKVQFIAQYRTDQARDVPIAGQMELIHGGRVVQTFPMKFGVEDDNQASVCYVNVQWEARDAALVGKNTARFVVKINGQQFTSTADFVLQQ
jgi:hypothetical protein